MEKLPAEGNQLRKSNTFNTKLTDAYWAERPFANNLYWF